MDILIHRYKNRRIEISRVAQSSEQAAQPQPPSELELKCLHDLQAIDPYEFPVSKDKGQKIQTHAQTSIHAIPMYAFPPKFD